MYAKLTYYPQSGPIVTNQLNVENIQFFVTTMVSIWKTSNRTSINGIKWNSVFMFLQYNSTCEEWTFYAYDYNEFPSRYTQLPKSD